MPKISEVCREVRSKNAGPFWITIDFFFKDAATFRTYSKSASLGPDLIASLYGVDPSKVVSQPVESLKMLKISYPRVHPQGWRGERDMHGGQFYARLLNVEID